MRIGRHLRFWASAPWHYRDLWRGLQGTGRPGLCLPGRGGQRSSFPPQGQGMFVSYQKSPGRGKRESIWIFSSINNAIKITSICRRRRDTNVPKQWCALIASNSDQFYCRCQKAASSGGSVLSFSLGGAGLDPLQSLSHFLPSSLCIPIISLPERRHYRTWSMNIWIGASCGVRKTTGWRKENAPPFGV